MAATIPRKLAEAMRWAWYRSQAHNPRLRHEEGGYIIVEEDGTLGVRWWQPGNHSSIVPSKRDSDGSYARRKVVGEFHTHPNPPKDEQGRMWAQDPSPIDVEGIRGENYSHPSYIVTQKYVWQISPDGNIERIGLRTKLLSESVRTVKR